MANDLVHEGPCPRCGGRLIVVLQRVWCLNTDQTTACGSHWQGGRLRYDYARGWRF